MRASATDLLTALHDEDNALERGEVVQRVAVERDQVGVLARLERACMRLDAERLRTTRSRREERVQRRYAEADRRLYLVGHVAVHAVGPEREPQARGQDRLHPLGDALARPLEIPEDERVPTVASLDPVRVEEDREGGD